MSNTIFIVSAEHSTVSSNINYARTQNLRRMLETAGLNVREVAGMYKGQAEHSILVAPSPFSAEDTRQIVLRAAQNFEQESVLEINNTGHSWLLEPYTGTQEFIGRMVRVKARDIDGKKVSGYTGLGDGSFLALEHEVNGDE